MTDLKVLKDALSESEEKYKKAMVSNAQLDNEKTTLQYQVDILKDKLEIQEESMNELQREYKEKCRELERQKHAYGILEHNVAELKEALRQRDELIEEQGLVLVGTANGEAETGEKKTKVALVTPEAAQMLEQAGEGTLDERLKRMAEEKEDLVDQIQRLEGQVNRYRVAAEGAEKKEDELKTEKRKLERELRSASDRAEELAMMNSHLEKRLDKLRRNREQFQNMK
uniref:Uncharacterized protein n=1 Tax=Branchiostoma floridae TaxID=7739 RepID=C3YBV4_BRAFL|eukprot:XP_002606206.1 hypothetical protein BRAFLDRAFT_288055 [Branchiostoma floridae]